jgi:hypothetical protein
MATITTNAQITASAQSVVTWGRTPTQQEAALLRAKRGAMWAEGKFGSFPMAAAGVSTFMWIDAAAATEYVEYCNTFTPPPVSAVVEDIPAPTAEV